MTTPLQKKEWDNPSALFSLGVKAAMESRFSLKALHAHLDEVKAKLISHVKVNAQQKDKLKIKAQKHVAQNELRKKHLEEEKERIFKRFKETEVAIESYELVKTNDDLLSHQDRSHFFLPYAISVFILLFLTLYLFLFYASTGFTLIFGIPETGNGILNPGIFSFALSRGGSTIVFVLLFPIVFLAVGFSVYATLSGIKKTPGEKRWGLVRLIAILTVTFIADVIIGYQISKGIYIRDYFNGLYQEAWSPSMAFSNVHFYLVLVMGFAIYLIWGFLLNYIIHHPYRRLLGDRTFGYEKIEVLETVYERLQKKMQDLEMELLTINETNLSLNSKIRKIDLGNLSDVFIYDIHVPFLNEFIKGYGVCLKNASGSDDQAKTLLAEVDSAYSIWLTQQE